MPYLLAACVLCSAATDAQTQVGDPPVITLTGANPQSILQNTAYVELGATASDTEDGDLTSSIVIDATAVDTSTVGSYIVTYSVTDSDSNTTTVNRTVNVTSNNSPVITLTGANPQSILQNTAYVELGATASDTEDGDLTSSIVIDATAVDTSTVGSYTVTYSVTDSDSNTTTVNRTVNVTNQPPTANDDSFTVVEDSSDNSLNVLANDSDPDAGDSLTITAVGTPNQSGSVSIVGGNALSYSPAPNFAGTETFTYTIEDSNGASDGATVTVTVSGVNDPPAFTSMPPTGGAQDSVYTYDVTTTDPDGDPLTITAPTLPNWLNLTDNRDGTATLTGTPTNNGVGSNSVSLQVSDGTASATQDFTIVVSNTNDPPSFTSTPVTIATQDQAYTYDVTATDPDTDDSLKITALTLPSWLTLTDNGDGTATLAGTPTNDDVGDHAVSLEVSDGTATDTQNFTISVGDVNDPPVAADDAFTVDEDSTGNSLSVLANDTDPDTGDSLTITNVGTPNQGGAVSIAVGGDTLTYSPAANFAGTETFSYTVEDNDGASATATVTVTVSNINDPPTANDDSFTVVEDSSSDLPVLANDTDPDTASGDTLTVTSVSTPDQGGTVAISSSGTTLNYTPSLNFSGTETFTYTVQDASGAPDTATVTVEVSSENDPPVIAPDPIPEQTVTENVPMSPLDLAQFVTDAENDSLTFALDASSEPLPDGLTMSADGVISGTPALDTSVGDHSIVFTVSDGQATVTSQPFILNVIGAGRVDLAVSVSATPNPAAVNQQATWTFTITNNAPDTGVPSTQLQATVGGDVPFVFDAPDPACTVSPSGNETLIDCVLSSPIPGGGTATIELTGSGNEAGDVVTTATVAVNGAEPVDETDRNDTDTATLSIAQSVSGTPAQQMDNIDARATATGDLNGDGFDDLAVATGPTEGTLVFLNIVDPSDPDKRKLSDTPSSLGGQGPTNGIAIVDLDGDGDLDIVTASGPGLANQVFLNNGDATFSSLALGDAATDSRAVAVGDIDGGGSLDLVFANGSPNDVYYGGGDATFSGPVGAGDDTSTETVGVTLVDLFGDLLPELVLANADGDAEIFANTAGVFSLAMTLPTGPTTSVASADFNGDGLPDLVFGKDTADDPATGPANLVFSNSSGMSPNFFKSAELGAAPTAAVIVTDSDLDGDPDLIFVNENGGHQIFVNTGTSSAKFALHPQQVAAANALAAAAGSLSVDDRVDLALAGPDGVGIFYNDGSGNFGLGDTGAPTLQLKGQSEVTVIVGEKYNDAGATATDSVDGDLTDRIVVDNPVDTAVIGSYTVRYTVTDLSGNKAAPITRSVKVQTSQPSGGGGGGASGGLFVLLLALATILGRLTGQPARRG